MSVFTRSGWIGRFGVGLLAVVGAGIATLQPAATQTRTLASLSDVPAYVPAPYHAHTATSFMGSLLYDNHPYYGGVYLGPSAHYWH